MKCIAIDDEPLALEVIKRYAAKLPALELVQTFDDAVSAAEYLTYASVNLLFLDINMPDISGLDLARSLAHKPMIIFTTAHKQFAYEGFELEAIDYLLKPIDFDRFARAVQKAKEFQAYRNAPASQPAESVFVHSEYRMVKILLHEIEYVESMEDYLKIHLSPGKSVITLMPLKKFVEKLPADLFKRIHRSYVIPLAKVKSIQNRKVLLSSGLELPIGDSYAGFIHEWKNS